MADKSAKWITALRDGIRRQCGDGWMVRGVGDGLLQRVQLKVVHWAHLKVYSMADPLAHLSVEPLARSLVLMLAPLLAGLMVY